MAKILGRPLSRYLKHILEIPKYIWYLFKCFFLFKYPLRLIWAYLSVSSLPDRVVELRNGLKLHLSEHPHDIITVFVIFVREDYGDISPGSIVVDVGANIGIFSLYAVNRKAARVYAYEPNTESYQYLLKNIQANYLQESIFSYQAAVTSLDGAFVKFPTKASMYNAIITDDDLADYEMVPTVSLPTILDHLDRVDLLKLDCEGAEYDILLNSRKKAELSKVTFIRLEYHCGKIHELGVALQSYGFTQHRLQEDAPTAGNIWFQRLVVSLFITCFLSFKILASLHIMG